AAGLALVRLDADGAQKLLTARLKKKFAAGLAIDADIDLLAELPRASAAAALLDVFQLDLGPSEKGAFARAAERAPDPRRVAALAALRDPRAVPVLRDILKPSNDTTWNGAAVRALGALGEKEFAPQFLEIVQDLKHPLAPAALVALGDLGEEKALPRVREGLASRNERVAHAAARAAGQLLALPGVKAAELRDQLAALFADAD